MERPVRLSPDTLMVGDVVEFDYTKQGRTRRDRWGYAYALRGSDEVTHRRVVITEVTVIRDGREDEQKFAGADETKDGAYRCFFYDRCTNAVLVGHEEQPAPVGNFASGDIDQIIAPL